MYVDINKVGDYAGYSQTAILKGFELATERACRRYFRTTRCYCDLSNEVVHIDFVLPKDRHALSAIKESYGIVYDDYDLLVPVALPLDKLPKRVAVMTQQDLIDAVKACQEKEVYMRWKKRENTLVEGVVTYDTDTKYLEIDVNGTKCRFERQYWIKEEASFLYKNGKVALYHVVRVTLEEGKCGSNIMLSRRSLAFPQLLLKSFLPIYKFQCNRRIPGRKSWITTNAPLSEKNTIEARSATSRELSGEIIELRNEKKGE
jgi:hypothetical protein